MQENTATTVASTPAAPRTDRLELVQEMGRGSVGQVHKAHSPQQDRTIALRQFEVPQWLDDVNELMMRIMAEARAASALEHSNIARLLTCGYKNFNVFVTSEFVEGRTLKDVMASRTPDLDEVLVWARQLLSALDYANEKGVYHHFLNPSNIKILADGSLKVLDFGLLRDKNLLTQTPAKKLENEPYLSPEQVNNKYPTRASNLFTAAAILYELYTTRSPFAGKHLGEVDRAITDSTPHPLNVANGRVPEAISRVVMKALSKDAAQRYQSGQELLTALEAASREPRPHAQAASKPATGSFPAMDTASFKVKAPAGPATAKVRVPVPPPTTTSRTAPPPTTTSRTAPPPTTTSRTAPATTISRTVPPPTVKRKAPSSANQWKLVGAVVAGLVLVAGIAMMFQRRPADLPVNTQPAHTQPAQTSSAPVSQPLPFSQQASAAPTDSADAATTSVPEPAERRSTAARSSRRARVPREVTEPAPTAPSQGQLAVNSNPFGATVIIQGQSGQWQTPQTIGPLAPGAYNVTVSKPGYGAVTRSVQVAAGGRANLDVSLTPTQGWVRVGGSPAGAAVLIDGRDTGKKTPAEVTLDPGSHSVTLHKPGYLDASTGIRLVAGQAVSYSPTLLVAGRTDNIRIVSGNKFFGGGASSDMARIEIKSEPKGAQVIVNGTRLQKTTPVEIQVDAGSYDITLQKEGYKPVHESAIVGADDRVKIDKPLAR